VAFEDDDTALRAVETASASILAQPSLTLLFADVSSKLRGRVRMRNDSANFSISAKACFGGDIYLYNRR
jgi:hypothetical protein